MRLMDFQGRQVAVVGLGVSNRAAIRYLLAAGARVTAFDRRPAAELGPLPAGVGLHAGDDYLDRLDPDGFDAIVVTPGMRKDAGPLAQARVPLHTEAGLVLERVRDVAVGITGSAGKTTTTSLVGRIVRRWRPGSLVGGNIGLPLLDRLDDLAPGGLVVLELSSFQLELAHASPHVAAITNIRPNHLDLHASFAAYVAAKKRIFRFQRPGDALILNAADALAAECAAQAPGEVVRFGDDGQARAEGGWVVWRGRRVLPVNDIRLPGAHNRENVLAAVAIAGRLGAPMEAVADVVRTFEGVEHRLETVRRRGGVLWINDSIATAPDRTQAALLTFDAPLVLLAGGYDKGLPFDDLAPLICERARVLILFGRTAPLLEAAVVAAGGGPEIVRVPDLASAVAAAASRAREGEVALLSPACASYDQFRNFEERGRSFKSLVAALP